jgi:hypothetical protein
VSHRLYRWRDGDPLVSDGPYSESKEHLAGFLLIDVDSQARAGQVAARMSGPTRRSNSASSCRPAATTSDRFGTRRRVAHRGGHPPGRQLHGALALMLLTQARSAARTNAAAT